MISQIELNKKIKMAEFAVKKMSDLLEEKPFLYVEKYPTDNDLSVISDYPYTYGHVFSALIAKLSAYKEIQ